MIIKIQVDVPTISNLNSYLFVYFWQTYLTTQTQNYLTTKTCVAYTNRVCNLNVALKPDNCIQYMVTFILEGQQPEMMMFFNNVLYVCTEELICKTIR